VLDNVRILTFLDGESDLIAHFSNEQVLYAVVPFFVMSKTPFPCTDARRTELPHERRDFLLREEVQRGDVKETFKALSKMLGDSHRSDLFKK
jgi:hypothetical protein